MTEAEKKYADIIDMPHYKSPTRGRMSVSDRAAQFSPFAALTGYDSAVEEAARLTDRKIELSEDMKTILNEKLQMIREKLGDRPTVTVTYFLPDEKKEGGAYVTVSGPVREISEYERAMVFTNKTVIPIDDIIEIE